MYFFFFQAEDGIRDSSVTGVQTCALPILAFVYVSCPRMELCGESRPCRSAQCSSILYTLQTMQMSALVCFILFASLCCGQQPPNLPAQREAMKKLAFLVGKWSGGATSSRGPNETVKVTQTEEVQFNLSGPVLPIERPGHTPAT